MFGDVVLCDFPFTSGLGSKLRPALVLFDLPGDAIICRVTSVLQTGPFDILLTDWREAGPLKLSVARVNRIITAEKAIFLQHLGHLSNRDPQAIRNAWNRHMVL
jgi:mRNA-degrading endonuclease toxin of MazEF toxin-antitoxin module